MSEASATLQRLIDSRNVPAKKSDEPVLDIQDERFFGHLRGLQDVGKAVELRRRDGSWPALRYVYLRSTEWLHAGEFHLHYITGEKVIVKGRNLRTAYDHLLVEKLAYLREAGEGERGHEYDLFVDELIFVPAADKDRVGGQD